MSQPEHQAIAYCYDPQTCVYTGHEECQLDPLESEACGEDIWLLPANATRTAPTVVEGKVPRWTGQEWEHIEDHRGEQGYVDGQPHEIKEYGPLPEGWSDTPPPPTIEELLDTLRSVRDGRISAVLWMRERHTDEIALGTEPTLTPEQYTALLTYIQALRDLPAQPGAPWDGGGIETPWPELPKT